MVTRKISKMRSSCVPPSYFLCYIRLNFLLAVNGQGTAEKGIRPVHIVSWRSRLGQPATQWPLRHDLFTMESPHHPDWKKSNKIHLYPSPCAQQFLAPFSLPLFSVPVCPPIPPPESIPHFVEPVNLHTPELACTMRNVTQKFNVT